MAEIRKFLWWRHLRSEPSLHVMRFRRGALLAEGRGLAFWFLPLSASVAQVPMDDRELQFHLHARSRDFQDVNTQGVITWRVTDARVLARRVDFSLDLRSGRYTKEPLESIALLLTQLAQQFAADLIVNTPIRTLLADGYAVLRHQIERGLRDDTSLAEMGLEIVTVRLAAIQPTAELERALQTPTREAIQQQADEATFARRALAVEKERAIQENELHNQIELARRREQLIEQEGQNARRQATEHAEARRIADEAAAAAERTRAAAEADAIGLVEHARATAEAEHMAIVRDLPGHVIYGLAARELAGKLERIDHLNISPELLGPLLHNLVEAGTRRLEEKPA